MLQNPSFSVLVAAVVRRPFRQAQGQRCYHRCYDQAEAGSTSLTIDRSAPLTVIDELLGIGPTANEPTALGLNEGG